MKTLISTLAITGLICTGVVLSPLAAKEDNPYIIHRQAIYKIADGHMQALKSILFFSHPAKEDVNFHATQLLEAFKHHGNAYPKGTHEGDTRAKMEIWEEPKEYKKKGQAMGAAIKKLITQSKNETMEEKEMMTTFKEMGKACKGCHEDFRKKK